LQIDYQSPVIARLIRWGENREEVRVLVLSSSRTNPTVQELVDCLSDYDLDVCGCWNGGWKSSMSGRSGTSESPATWKR
jgi:hypothetical protein